MADTRRTLAELLTLLADAQAAGDISENDLRDLAVSLTPRGAGLYVSSAAATTIGVLDTWVKAAGTTTTTHLDEWDTNSLDNRLRYTGAPDVHVMAMAHVSLSTAGTNDNLRLGIAKNGTIITGSEQNRFVGTGTDVGAMSCAIDVDLVTNDYLEMFVKNVDAAANITLDLGYLHVSATIALA